MTLRVVMRREVPRKTARRTMWRMWSMRGYSSRPCPHEPAQVGWVALEFWIEAPIASREILASYEWELDDALLSREVRAEFVGSGSRLEA
ncbi:hypothetical protein [Microbacterium sp. P02]|uniref:hypothetical protein n=1 Tax=Microbacterium sp. P02 TaxID=3366260 RepID=UPI00366F2F4C